MNNQFYVYDEILFDTILFNLSVVDMFSFVLVCKKWKRIFNTWIMKNDLFLVDKFVPIHSLLLSSSILNELARAIFYVNPEMQYDEKIQKKMLCYLCRDEWNWKPILKIVFPGSVRFWFHYFDLDRRIRDRCVICMEDHCFKRETSSIVDIEFGDQRKEEIRVIICVDTNIIWIKKMSLLPTQPVHEFSVEEREKIWSRDRIQEFSLEEFLLQKFYPKLGYKGWRRRPESITHQQQQQQQSWMEYFKSFFLSKNHDFI